MFILYYNKRITYTFCLYKKQNKLINKAENTHKTDFVSDIYSAFEVHKFLCAQVH